MNVLFTLFIDLIVKIVQMDIFVYCFGCILVGSLFSIVRWRLM